MIVAYALWQRNIYMYIFIFSEKKQMHQTNNIDLKNPDIFEW